MAKLPAPKAPLKTGQQRARDAIDYAHSLQEEQLRRNELTAVQKDHDAAIAKGVLPTALPELKEDMSRSDIRDAAGKIGYLAGGKTTSAQDHFGDLGAAPGERTAMGGALRGSTPAEIQDFYDSDPINGTAAKETQARVAAVAGTGQEVQTPYGKVSSRIAQSGEPMTPTIGDRSLGPQHPSPPTALDKVAAKYPDIAKGGSLENQAFAKAYNDAAHSRSADSGAETGPIDPMAIADKTMADVAKNGPNADLPTPEMPLSEAPPKPAAPPASGFAAGQAVRNAPAKAGGALESAGGAIKNAVGAAGDAVDNFEAGLTGKTVDQVRGGTPVPDPSVGPATPEELDAARAKASAGSAKAYADAGVAPPVRTNTATAPSNPAAPSATAPPTATPQPEANTAPAAAAAPATPTADAGNPDKDALRAQVAAGTLSHADYLAKTGLVDARATSAPSNAPTNFDHFGELSQPVTHMSSTTAGGAPMGNTMAAQGTQSKSNANPDDDFAAFTGPTTATPSAPMAASGSDSAAPGGRNNTAGQGNLETFAQNPEEDEFQKTLNNQEAA